MELPDGTAADVTALENDKGALMATITARWPDGRRATAWMRFTPVLNMTAGPIEAPGRDPGPGRA